MLKSVFSLAGKEATLGNFVTKFAETLKAQGCTVETMIDVEKAVEAKKAEAVERKAMYTTNAGGGQEFVGQPTQVSLLDLMVANATVTQKFTNLGSNLNKRDKVVISVGIGDHDLASESTTGFDLLDTTTGQVPTAELNIDQRKFKFVIDISDEQQKFTNIVDMMAYAQDQMRRSFSNTSTKLVINGDIVTAATGNVNSVDAAPAATKYYLAGDGIRKILLAQTGAGIAVNVGTISTTKLLSMYGKLGEYAADLSSLVWLVDSGTYAAIAALPEYLQAYANGGNSTVNSPFLRGPLGIDLITTNAIPLTNTAGAVSVTPANNTKGTVILAHKNLIQWGTNGDYMVEVFRNPGKGYKIIGTYYMGIVAVAPATVSGLNFPLGVIGYNVTI